MNERDIFDAMGKADDAFLSESFADMPEQASAEETIALPERTEHKPAVLWRILLTAGCAAACIAVICGLGAAMIRLNKSKPEISVQASFFQTELVTAETTAADSTEPAARTSVTGRAKDTKQNTEQTTEATAPPASATGYAEDTKLNTEQTTEATAAAPETTAAAPETTAAAPESTAANVQLPEEAEPEAVIAYMKAGFPMKMAWDSEHTNSFILTDYRYYGIAFLCRDDALPSLEQIGNYKVFHSDGVWANSVGSVNPNYSDTEKGFTVYDEKSGTYRSVSRQEYADLKHKLRASGLIGEEGILAPGSLPCIVQPMSGFLSRYGDRTLYTIDCGNTGEKAQCGTFSLINDYTACITPGWTLCMASPANQPITGSGDSHSLDSPYLNWAPDVTELLRALKENSGTVLLGAVYSEESWRAELMPPHADGSFDINVVSGPGIDLNPAILADFGEITYKQYWTKATVNFHELRLSDEVVSGMTYRLTESGEKDYTDAYRAICEELEKKPGVILAYPRFKELE